MIKKGSRLIKKAKNAAKTHKERCKTRNSRTRMERHDLIRTESIYVAQDKDPRPPQRVGTNTNAYTTRLYNPTQSSGQLEAPEGGL